jgi:uncharacterized protein YndB with AHSA1/START domain
MLKTIAFSLAVMVVALLAYASTRPDSFRVERSTTIKAPMDKVFGLVNDFHQWQSWSPWEKLDPAMVRTFTGPNSGKGTVYAWSSDGKAGAGRMEILDAPAPTKVLIKLDFIKPFEAHNTAEFTLTPVGDSTQINWAMYGPSPFIAKVMGVFFSMDSLVGKDFAEGLANLKAVAEH